MKKGSAGKGVKSHIDAIYFDPCSKTLSTRDKLLVDDSEGLAHGAKYRDPSGNEWTIIDPNELANHSAERASDHPTLQIMKVAHHGIYTRFTMPNDPNPPKFAEFLLAALATPCRADAAIGDLNEHFTRDCNEFGRDRAVRLYSARTLRSLWPLLRRAIVKALKWGAVLATVKRFL